MKLSKLFFGVAAAAMFAACSSDDVAQNNWEGVFDVDGNAYLKVAITTPNVVPASRAAGYDGTGGDYSNYNDGLAEEYAVNDATLYIYGQKLSTDTENQFVCIKGYNLTGLTWDPNTNAWITKDATNVVQIDEKTAVGYYKLWALVVLNKTGWTQPTTGGIQTFGDYAALTSTGQTGKLTDFTKGFYMSNMPYANAAAPGITKINTLYPVDIEKIKPTKLEAESGEAATIVNVERGVAKVQVIENIAAADQHLPTPHEAATYTFGNWFIDNYNTTAYTVRHCEAPTSQYSGATALGYLNYNIAAGVVNGYRFAHPTAVTTGAYRTDWAIDPNYDVDVTTQLTTVKGAATAPAGLPTIEDLATAQSYYFHENTFPVNHQTELNTTRVIVPAIFNGGKNFVTLGSEPDVVYDVTTLTTLENKVLNFLEIHYSPLATWKTTHMSSGTLADALNITFTAAAGPLAITVDFDAAAATSLFTDKTAAQTAFTTIKASVDAFLAANESYTYYAGGVAYYPILIKHFGDYDTPWTPTTDMTANTPGLIYGYTPTTEATAEKNYLGRYGVVRNNWYRIRVTGISKIGDPTISPIIDNRTDDKVEAAYIKYSVNMVPWVLRGIQDAPL